MNRLLRQIWPLLCAMTMMMGFATRASTNSVAAITGQTKFCAQFILQDQYQQTHEFKFPRNRPTVLTVADKKGSEGILNWVQPLAKRFGDKIIIAGLADVSSVPPALRGLVRTKFKSALQYPVMLDWAGDASRGFDYTRGKANVYLVSADGRILHRVAGNAEPARLGEMITLIEREISQTSQAKVPPH